MTDQKPTERRKWTINGWDDANYDTLEVKEAQLRRHESAVVTELLPGDVILTADDVAKVKNVLESSRGTVITHGMQTYSRLTDSKVELIDEALDLLERLAR